MPSDKLAELKKDLASLEDENKLLANEVKTYTMGILHHKSLFCKTDAHIFVIQNFPSSKQRQQMEI